LPSTGANTHGYGKYIAVFSLTLSLSSSDPDSAGPSRHGGKIVNIFLATQIVFSYKKHDSRTVEKLAFSRNFCQGGKEEARTWGGNVEREMTMIAFVT